MTRRNQAGVRRSWHGDHLDRYLGLFLIVTVRARFHRWLATSKLNTLHRISFDPFNHSSNRFQQLSCVDHNQWLAASKLKTLRFYSSEFSRLHRGHLELLSSASCPMHWVSSNPNILASPKALTPCRINASIDSFKTILVFECDCCKARTSPVGTPPQRLNAAVHLAGCAPQPVRQLNEMHCSGKWTVIVINCISLITKPRSILAIHSFDIKFWHVVTITHDHLGVHGGFKFSSQL